jgi:hypothetical protein
LTQILGQPCEFQVSAESALAAAAATAARGAQEVLVWAAAQVPLPHSKNH